MSALLLADAKTYLNITGTSYDTLMQSIIDAAESAITAKCGPLTATAVTQQVVANVGVMVLTTLPAIELVSITPWSGGSPLDLTGITLDGASGLVSNVPSGSYVVTYTAGRAPCPPDLLLAVKELVRHLWESQRGGTRRPGSTVSDATSNTIPGAAYLFPFRVSELIAPHMQPGFA